MARETKIGLAVIGVLLLVFGTLLFRKLVASDVAAGPPEDPAGVAARPLTTAGMADKRHVVVSENNPAERTGRGNARDAEPPADVPPAVYMPTDSASAKSSPPDRYDNQRAGAAADDELKAEGRAASSHPFHRGSSPSAGADDEHREDGSSGAPRRLPKSPHEPARLQAGKDRPPTLARVPVRRASAEEPIGDGTPSNDKGPDEIPDALPEASALVESHPQEPAAAPADSPGPAPRLAEVPEADPPQAEVARAPEPRQPTEWQRGAADPPAAARNEPVAVENGKYTIQPNDSLWAVSEKVYGNGRYFKAIYEHNRARLPHADHLTVGTVIAVPPASVLEQTYPTLCPKQRKSAIVKSRAVQASTRQRTASGDNVYIVEEGDTLFDIARYELGKASRWSEIYDLNREALGSDFDYLQPGTELAMPPKAQGSDAVTRQGDSRYQR